eukprot:1446089-Pyramimonas_sp.AAC.2
MGRGRVHRVIHLRHVPNSKGFHSPRYRYSIFKVTAHGGVWSAYGGVWSLMLILVYQHWFQLGFPRGAAAQCEARPPKLHVNGIGNKHHPHDS